MESNNILKRLADFVSSTYKMTDEQLAIESEIMWNELPDKLKSPYSIIERIVLKRIKGICKKENILLEEYAGPLVLRLRKKNIIKEC